MKFFERMFTQFFDRHMPDSTAAKPRFMKNTSMAVMSTHIVSSMTLISTFVGPVAAAGSAAAGAAATADSAGLSGSAARSEFAGLPHSSNHPVNNAIAHIRHIAVVPFKLNFIQNGAKPFVPRYTRGNQTSHKLDLLSIAIQSHADCLTAAN